MKKYFVLTLIFLSVLTGCSTVQPVKTVNGSFDEENQEARQELYVEISGEKVLWDGKNIIEPPSRLDNIYDLKFFDFGSCFEEEYSCEVSTYRIVKGTDMETTVYHIHSSNSGPVIYICAGIHGNEKAAWQAGILLRNATISCGDLYVISQANVIGSDNDSRFADPWDDPNRFFPGKKDGKPTEYLDWCIFSDIEEKNPDFVLDLHEAILYSDQVDFLGSSYIITQMEGDAADVAISMSWDSADGLICHNEFSIVGPGTKGSLNETVSNILGIPTITVETFRGFDVYRRIADQLDSVEYVLKYYGMR